MQQSIADAALSSIRAEPIMVDGKALAVTANLGSCLQLQQAESGSGAVNRLGWEAQLQKADIALYQAKVSGRDRAVMI